MSILWKEWRQQRLLFVLGAGLGVLFPCFDMLSRRKFGSYNTHAGSGEVAILGGLYALILAIATSHDDIQHGVSEFWQSRPVSVARVFLAKVLVGAGVVLLTFAIAQSLDFLGANSWWGEDRMVWNVTTVTWPVAVLVFAAAMFLTVLMRDPARSVMVAVWLLLMIYFLPLLTGSLRWMNVFDMFWEGGRTRPSVVMDILVPLLRDGHVSSRVVSGPVGVPAGQATFSQWLRHVVTLPEYVRYLVFVAVMMAGSGACLALSIAAVKRNWRWQPGQKTLAWAIGLSGAFIFALAMFQVGHNLLPATRYDGKPINPVIVCTGPVEKAYDWTGQSAPIAHLDSRGYGWPGARTCTSGNYLFAVAYVNRDPSGQSLQIEGLLDIYQHPGVAGYGKIVSRTRFVSMGTWASSRYLPEELPVVSTRDGRLFIAYQVCVPAEDGEQPAPDRTRRSYSLRMLVVDVNDPAEPKRIADVELDRSLTQVFQSNGDSLYGEYCYIWGQKQLLVVSLAEPDKPQVVRKISIADFGLGEDHDPAVGQVSVAGDKLLCAGPRMIVLLDLADPQAPRPIFRRILSPAELQYPSLIYAALYAGDLLYVSTDNALEIYRLQRTATGDLQGELVGRRPVTPLERLAGRQPHGLLLRQGLLYEADDRFGMLVYDVSDPTRPRRAYHASGQDWITSIGLWQGLLYMDGTAGTLTLVAMP